MMCNYRYVPEELEENHEEFVRTGQTRVSSGLFQEQRHAASLWKGETSKQAKRGQSAD